MVHSFWEASGNRAKTSSWRGTYPSDEAEKARASSRLTIVSFVDGGNEQESVDSSCR